MLALVLYDICCIDLFQVLSPLSNYSTPAGRTSLSARQDQAQVPPVARGGSRCLSVPAAHQQEFFHA